MAEASETASPASSSGRTPWAFLARRWPSAVALSVGVNTFFDAITDGLVRSLAEAMLLLPTMYVVMAALGPRRRRYTWLVLILSIAVFIGLRAQDRVDPSIVIAAVALAAALWGVGHGRHRDRGFGTALLGMLLFGALAIAGEALEPQLARYVVAAGWFGHGIWDIVHLVKDRVVARSWAEWCAVVDILIAVSLIVVPFYH